MGKSISIAILLLFSLVVININTYGQNPISIESVNLYLHGTNSSNLVGPVAAEGTDSVTINSTTKYYVMPDQIVNPSFNFATDPYSAGILSTFTWTAPAGLSSGGVHIVAAYPTAPHYKQFTWTVAGTGNILVQETSNLLCDGNVFSTPVEVIAQPAVTAISIPNISCHAGTIPYTLAGPTSTLTISCSVKGQKNVSIVYSLTGPTGFAPHNNIAKTMGNSSSLDLSAINLTHPGIYTLTINTITDRIANKCGLNAIASGTSQTFAVTPQPVTSPTYHITNQ